MKSAQFTPGSPAALGYRMPAEWEPHEATWLSWPHKLESWPGAFEEVPGVFAQIAKHLSRSELVRINVAGDVFASQVLKLLHEAGADFSRIRFHFNPTNDAWVRDHGPIYVVREHAGKRQRAIIDWDYNAWGNKYPPFDLDNAIPSRIAAEFGEERFCPGIVMEGGSIDVDGRGTLMTSEQCLLNPNRNPHLSKQEIEQKLSDYLGITRFLWLGEGIVGDDTDGHIDDLTRFIDPHTVLTVVEPDPLDENHRLLQDNLDRLKTMRAFDGEPLRVVTVPMPLAMHYEGQRLPASYANFYIANKVVLAAVYGQERDQILLDTLQELYPDREVVGINCLRLVWGLGAIHCVTQQQPTC
jgi:agmatine deiminase